MATAFTRTKSSKDQLEKTALERLIWEGTRKMRQYALGFNGSKTINAVDRGNTTNFQNLQNQYPNDGSWCLVPIEPEEDPKDYVSRIFRSYNTSYFKKAIVADSGKVFSDGIKIEDTQDAVKQSIESFFEDVDREGTDAVVYFSNVFQGAEREGVVGTLVQFFDPGNSRTLAEQQASGARPYLTEIKIEDLLGWSIINGELDSIRVQFVRTMAIDFEEKEEMIVAEIKRNQINIYTKDNDTIPIETAPNTLGVVPLVECNFNSEGFFKAASPYANLADKNLELFNSSSDQSNILHYARVPLMHIARSDKDDEANVRIAGNAIIETELDGTVAWVELQGKSIEEGQKDLDRIKSEINDIGLELINSENRPDTATGEIIDANENNAELETLVPLMQDHIKNVIQLVQKLNSESGEFKIVLNNDFSPGSGGKDAENVRALADKGHISSKAATESPSIERLLPENYDHDTDQAQLDKEATDRNRRFADTTAPGTEP